MQNDTILLQTLLENAFLNTITPTVGIVGATCERLFGRGTTAIVKDIKPDQFTLELKAKGATSQVHFKTAPAIDTDKNIRITGVVMGDIPLGEQKEIAID